jgi:hypothetical protein
VRTQASKLRSNLAEYYATEGRDDPIRIELQKGSYVPVFRSAGALPVPRPSRRRIAIAAAATCGATVPLFVFLSRRALQQPASIAVLPFVDLGPAKDQEYFCDGMAEEI